MVATMPAVEMLRFAPESPRTLQMFAALLGAARGVGVKIDSRDAYCGDASVLLLWGPGEPERAEIMRSHVAAGGRVLAFDLAYWDRGSKLRVSIDAAHPQAHVMRRSWPTSRLEADGITVSSDWNPSGPIVVAGLGHKARAQYGSVRIDEWEADMMRACAARWARPIIYRPKKHDSRAPSWATRVNRDPNIVNVLRGASLVVTWHSNVAVDAIRMGIPVICGDGAAAAVCPSGFGDANPCPLPETVRDRFLANLAWFQWAPTEADAFWRWAREVMA